MTFTISLASLADQNDSGIGMQPGDLIAQALRPSIGSSPTMAVHEAPQVFLINPSGDNIFRHISPENAHAAIIGLIYFSMWMGALGWDIVSTLCFDIRVIRETNWTSLFSSIYSIAYLLSRYVSLAWIITAVTNSVVMTASCSSWMKASTSLFSIGISATMLVFCLRTCSIWHMRSKVVIPVVGCWILVAAFALLLPIMSDGDNVKTSYFCAWHFNGLYVIGIFASLLVFDVLCLALTVLKLNKAGWRGMARGILPRSRHNYDSEDVKTMLVQKTTAFFVIQFVFLTSALLLFVLTDQYSYRLMNIVASLAAASSMAGRIFRKAWRQTRELAPERLNRPPSYYPAWADEHRARPEPGDFGPTHVVHLASRPDTAGHDSSGSGRGGTGGAAGGGFKRPARRRPDSLDFYVEGELGPKSYSASSVSLRSAACERGVMHLPWPATATATAAQAYAAQHMDTACTTDSGTMARARLYRAPYDDAGDEDADMIQVRNAPRLHGAIIHSTGPETVSAAPFAVERAAEQERLIRQALTPALREDLNPAPSYTRHLLSHSDDRRRSQGSSEDVGARSSTVRRLGTADSATTETATGIVFRLNSFGARSSTTDAAEAYRNPSLVATADPEPLSGPFINLDGRWSRRPSATSLGSRTTEGPDRPALEIEERRKRYIASPPMSAGARLSSKEENRRVYDFESVKAAARIEPLPGSTFMLSKQDTIRPSTTSNAEQRRPALGGSELPSTPPHGSLANMSQGSLRDGGNGAGLSSHEFGSVGHEQLTPRPRTAPAWPSPLLSPSESISSQLTILPGQMLARGPSTDNVVPETEGENGSNAQEELDAVFAFGPPIEEGPHQMMSPPVPRPRSGRSRSGTSERLRRGEGSRDGDLRPRTSRGAGLNSFGRVQAVDGRDGELDSAATTAAEGPGRPPQEQQHRRSASNPPRREPRLEEASSQQPGHGQRPRSRPETAKSRGRPASSQRRRLHSSASSRSRLTSADGTAGSNSGGGTRPSTAAGEDVKPFGFGILHHRNGLPSSLSLSSSSSLATEVGGGEEGGEDDEGKDVDCQDDLVQFGSAIERQYAKLAAEAGMAIDMP